MYTLISIFKVLGIEHPDASTLYKNLGALYDLMGKNHVAEEYYLKSI